MLNSETNEDRATEQRILRFSVPEHKLEEFAAKASQLSGIQETRWVGEFTMANNRGPNVPLYDAPLFALAEELGATPIS